MPKKYESNHDKKIDNQIDQQLKETNDDYQGDEENANIIDNFPWIIGVIFLIIFFIFFGHYSVKTSMPSYIGHDQNDLPTEDIDYLADTAANHNQDIKIIYGKGNQLKRNNVPSHLIKKNNREITD